MTHPRTDRASVMLATMNTHNLSSYYLKLCAHGLTKSRGTSGRKTLMSAQEPIISMVVMVPLLPSAPPCKDSFIRKHGVNYEEIE
jgi:hypothetical protein